MNARWTTDAECIRNRVGTLPDYERHGKRRFTLQGSLVVLAIVGAFLMGLAW